MSVLAGINALAGFGSSSAPPVKRNILIRLPNKDTKTTTDDTIILDLDETCVHTYDNMVVFEQFAIPSNQAFLALRPRLYQISIDTESGTTKMWGVKRPHLREFLLFCFSYFKCVTVWTAGIPAYAEAICREIFRGIDQPHFLLTREECVTNTTTGRLYKPISILQNYPYAKDWFSPEKTYILDDRVDTAIDNPNNLIAIRAYAPSPTLENISQEDPALLQLMYWLSQNKDVKDVRTVSKSLIFSKPLSTYLEELRRTTSTPAIGTRST